MRRITLCAGLFLLQRSGEIGGSRRRDPGPALLVPAVPDLIGAPPGNRTVRRGRQRAIMEPSIAQRVSNIQ